MLKHPVHPVRLGLLIFWTVVAVRLISAHEPITTKIRFNREVVRIFQASCLGCHRPGGMAPMSLATYEEARPWAKAIKEEVLEKRMPPWPAVKGYGAFCNAPPLTARDIDIIVSWVEGGAPPGDPKDLPAGLLFSDDWPLGAPDRILPLAAADRVACPDQAYRCFALPAKWKEDRWITAVDLKPGPGPAVHCATFYLDKGPAARDRPRGRSRLPGPPPAAHTLGTWIPGQKICAWPDGVAWRWPAGWRVVVRIHYQETGETAAEHPALGLYFAKTSVHKPLREVTITDPNAVIPTDAARPVQAHFTVMEDAEALAIRPSAHRRVRSLEATASRPDGTVDVLVWTRDRRFDWPLTYHFKRPVALPKGTRMAVTAYFDSPERGSERPAARPLRWSDLSVDPLCTLVITGGRPSR